MADESRWAIAGLAAVAGVFSAALVATVRRAQWARLPLPRQLLRLRGVVAEAAEKRPQPHGLTLHRRVWSSAASLCLLQRGREGVALEAAPVEPLLPPYAPGVYIAELDRGHRLLFSPRHLCRGHLLVAAKQSDLGWKELSENDFLWAFLLAGATQGICFYDSDEAAGAECALRVVHVLPEDAFRPPLLARLRKAVGGVGRADDRIDEESIVLLPWLASYRAVCLRLAPPDARQEPRRRAQYLKRAYHFCKRRLGARPPFNLLFGERWMVVALRRDSSVLGAAVNALGVLGCAVVADGASAERLGAMSEGEFLSRILAEKDRAPSTPGPDSRYKAYA